MKHGKFDIVLGKVDKSNGMDGLAILRVATQVFEQEPFFISGSRFFERRHKLRELIDKWKERLQTEGKEQALEEFDDDLFRANWKEFVKEALEGKRKIVLGASVRRDEEIGRARFMEEQSGFRLELEGFDLPKKKMIYTTFEKPDVFFSELELYLMKIDGHTVSIKKIRFEEGVDNIPREWKGEGLEDQDVCFCFITAVGEEKSFVLNVMTKISKILAGEKIFAQYVELPTAYLSEEAKKDCFVIDSDEFDTLLARLGITNEGCLKNIAIKPAFSEVLQVFTTEGWGVDEDYEEKRKILLLSGISISLLSHLWQEGRSYEAE